MHDVHVYQRKLKSGVMYTYRFEIAPVNGKRQFETKGGFPTKAAAKEAGKKAQHEYETLGHVVNVSDMSFADFLDEWLKSLADLKPLTIQNYEKKIRLYIKPVLGKYRLKAIENADLQNLITSLYNNGRSINTLSTIKGILASSLKYAVMMKYIAYTPFIDVRIPKNVAPKNAETIREPHIYISKELMDKIFERFPERANNSHNNIQEKTVPAFLPLMLGYRCGLRLGEAFGLTWDDIDLEKKEITIRRQVQWMQLGKAGYTGRGGDKRKNKEQKKQTLDEDDVGYWYFTKPKYNSVRIIDIDDEFVEILKRKKAQQEKAMDYYGDDYIRYYLSKDSSGNPFISVKPNDTPLSLLCVRDCGSYTSPRIMQHASRIISGVPKPKKPEDYKPPLHPGLEEFDFHSLRHTHATELVNSGARPEYVKERLGHRNIETTMNIYYHLTESERKKESAKLNTMF